MNGFGDLLARVEATSDAMDRRDASGWLVVCIDLECIELGESDAVVGCYGPYDSPEEALIAAGRHATTSLPLAPGEKGWAHLVKPLYPGCH
jgi:hypothetical protein